MPEPIPPRYANARPLGEGSFATVVAADDTVLGRAVALKLLRDELLGDAAARRRFAREVRTAADLGRHPSVVTVHDAGEWAGRPYLVLELLAGSVGDRLRAGAVPERLALRWLAQAAAALDFAHARGVVHRDVKPANLLLDEFGDVRLADFGVARGDTLGEALTLTGAVVGSPGYLAPEVAAGGVATPASDRYSLAVVARELLGDRPALSRGLARDPAERYPTAAALVDALGGEAPPTRVAGGAAARAALLRRTMPAAAALRPPRRHRALRRSALAVAAGVIGAAAAAGVVLALRTPPRVTTSHGPATVQTCTLSPERHDANVVLHGLGAARTCRSLAHTLRLQGDLWTYHAGGELVAPDHGVAALGVVCRLRRGALAATVYDSGGRAIGGEVCAWYRGGGWEVSTPA